MAGCSWMSRSAFAYALALMAIGVGRADHDETDYVTLSASECIAKPTQIVLRLPCSTGQMVRLLRIFLGNSTRGTCEYSKGDCIMDLPSTENYPCIGTESCRITMSSANLGRQIPKCREASNYVEALYQCIPESDSVSVCDRSRSLVISQRGFVRTPGYPLNYPNNMDCNLTLVAPHDDQRLKLFVIDLNLEANGTACSDWLQVFDGFQSNTLCGQRTRYWLRNSTQRTMHVHFNSDGSRQGKGFWLYYEAFPLMPTAPSTSPPPPTSVSSSSASTILLLLLLQPPMESNSSSRVRQLPSAEAVASSSSYASTYSESSSSSSNQVIYVATEASTLPLGILLAVVITLLICILLILLIIVFIKSRSTGRHLPTVPRLPGSDERMDNLEREQRGSFYPSSSSPRSSSSFRDSAAGNRTTDPHQEDALLSSAYSSLRKKDIL